ncbi:MAG: hypothetical protein HUU49_00930 [Candidatus Buchananbacteria bacterium]|nr:hypothetical protein [Candidatus Buchananbacteria bacterium]
MSKLLNSKSGFTIIESTIAILILLVAIFGIMQFFPLGIKIIGDSQSQTMASNIALSKIEEIRSLNYEDISTGTIEAKNRVSSDPASPLYNFQRQTTVETVDNNFNSSASDVGLKKITVTVFWQSPVVLKEKSTEIQYIISDY